MIRPEASTCPSREQNGRFWVICAGQDSDVQGLCSHLHPLGPNVQAPGRNREMQIPGVVRVVRSGALDSSGT